jgi:hypothetical protein
MYLLFIWRRQDVMILDLMRANPLQGPLNWEGVGPENRDLFEP